MSSYLFCWRKCDVPPAKPWRTVIPKMGPSRCNHGSPQKRSSLLADHGCNKWTILLGRLFSRIPFTIPCDRVAFSVMSCCCMAIECRTIALHVSGSSADLEYLERACAIALFTECTLMFSSCPSGAYNTGILVIYCRS